MHSSKTNLLCDVGMFFPSDANFIKMLATRETWQAGVTIPSLARKYYHCFISHGHIDHYAGLFALNSEIKIGIYTGNLTYRLIRETVSQLNTMCGLREGIHYPKLRCAGELENANPLTIGDFRIIPFKVRHNIPDCWAFIIEHEKLRLLYAGEFMNKFWAKESSLIRNIDAVIVSCMPQISIGGEEMPSSPGENELIFYVTTGEDLESIESCFQKFFPLPLFKSPYVAHFLGLLPEKTRNEFPLLNNSLLFQTKSLFHTFAPSIIACNYAELIRYLRILPADVKILVISNDFNLSKDAAVCGKKHKLNRAEKIIMSLKERGRFVDAFQNPHGTQELIKQLLTHLLSFRSNIKVMVTHTVDYSLLSEAFPGRIEVVNRIAL
jgi:hypothetical protein